MLRYFHDHSVHNDEPKTLSLAADRIKAKNKCFYFSYRRELYDNANCYCIGDHCPYEYFILF